MKAVELFAGAGGLALGVARAGFRHALLVEYDRDACSTLRANTELLGCLASSMREVDSREVDYTAFRGCDLVVGGPPCQPFSLGGKHHGPLDDRDMFPEAVRAVREIRPRAFLFENVKGLLRRSFQPYFRYITLQLRYPGLPRLEREDWTQHAARLETVARSKMSAPLEYEVHVRLLNAADYGVPQHRERVFIVGTRSDLGVRWSFPEPTHSREALIRDQSSCGTYWSRHGLLQPNAAAQKGRLPKSDGYQLGIEPVRLPWRTVRDAIGHLQAPDRTRPDPNNQLVEGARSYRGHTGSRLDQPSKTLKAGDHGVPGGENTLAISDGSVRYFTVRECACIQTFPEDYRFEGSWTERMRQIGNAVPPLLAQTVAARLGDLLTRQAPSTECNQPRSLAASAALRP